MEKTKKNTYNPTAQSNYYSKNKTNRLKVSNKSNGIRFIREIATQSDLKKIQEAINIRREQLTKED